MTGMTWDGPGELAGDVAMAEMMARWDWSSTPVGPPSSSPLALRTVVRLILRSRFPMWAGWGQELTFFTTTPTARYAGPQAPLGPRPAGRGGVGGDLG